MILTVLALIQATQPLAPVDPVASDRDVVVVGARVRNATQALADCIARACPPNEEMVASLRKATAEFAEGDYLGGRRSMGSARRRNAKYAREYPKLVSELSRVDARLASLLGMRGAQLSSTIDALDALRRGLPEGDAAILMQRLEVGDAYLLARDTGGVQFAKAQAMYRGTAQEAKRLGLTKVYGRALLRPAIIYAALASSWRPYRQAALDALDTVDATRDPALADVREAAIMVRARLALSGGSPEERSAAIRALGSSVSASTVPVALHAPPVKLELLGVGSNSIRDLETAGSDLSLVTNKTTVQEFDIDQQWVDVSYRITPEGHVEDVEVVGQGDPVVNSWLPAVRKALAERRYSPLPTGDGLFRLERFSMVSDLEELTGTRIRRRTASPHVESTDLSGSALAAALRTR